MQIASGARVYFAVYDANGKMLGIAGGEKVDAGRNATLSVACDAGKATQGRIFFLDDEFKPNAPAQNIAINHSNEEPSSQTFDLKSYWPEDGSNGFYPTWNYITIEFNKDLDASMLQPGTLASSAGKQIPLSANRGSTSYSTYLASFSQELELNTQYTLTVPPNSIYSTDGDVYEKEIRFSFTTASNVVRIFYSDYTNHFQERVELVDENDQVAYTTIVRSGSPSIVLTDVTPGNYNVWVNSSISLGTITVQPAMINSFSR